MGLNIQIGDDAARIVEANVASGRYGSAKEVVEAALEQLDMSEQPEFDQEQIAWLRAAAAEGEASGEPQEIDFKEFLVEARRRLAAGA